MAIFQPGSLLWRLQLNHTLHGQMCQNAFHFVNRGVVNESTTPLSSHSNAVIASFQTRILNDVLDLWNNQVALISMICTTIVPSSGPISEQIHTATTGFQANESLPSYCAAILSLRSGFGGKSYRGRVYFAGVSEDHHDSSKLGVDSFDALINIGNKLIANYGPTGSDSLFRYVIFSRLIGTALTEDNTIAGCIPVVQCVPRRNLGTQRHRLLGQGT